MGIIQCGSFTGNTTVNIGWEPQWIMIKRTDAAGDWIVIDSMRGCSVGGVDAVLNPNLANAESSANDYIDFTATGFITKNLTGTYIYTVIRRPNKPPTTGTQVYNAVARTGTGAAATVTGVGFAPDLAMIQCRSQAGFGNNVFDRLRGALNVVFSYNTNAEQSAAATLTGFDNMDGVVLGADSSGYGVNQNTKTYINHFFRRAPGFMDVVCFKGDGTGGQRAHNLYVPPELIIQKSRSTSGINWGVTYPVINSTATMSLNLTDAAVSVLNWSGTPTTFKPRFDVTGTDYGVYLFATLPGISKVGSYTGNGSSQTINCGFSTGARFILIKRTDSTGDWYVWSSATGIVAANDPHLSLNTTAAEVTTDDSVDPDPLGFAVLQNAATNINVNGATYIFLAIS